MYYEAVLCINSVLVNACTRIYARYFTICQAASRGTSKSLLFLSNGSKRDHTLHEGNDNTQYIFADNHKSKKLSTVESFYYKSSKKIRINKTHQIKNKVSC